jgi:AP-1 complex subunit gamma-1
VAKLYHTVRDNYAQTGLVQLAVWLIGEFGEMLVNGTCKNADGSQMVVPAEQILEMYERILADYGNGKVERGDIIIMWSLTALSKMSIRLGNDMLRSRIIESLKKFEGNANVEI